MRSQFVVARRHCCVAFVVEGFVVVDPLVHAETVYDMTTTFQLVSDIGHSHAWLHLAGGILPSFVTVLFGSFSQLASTAEFFSQVSANGFLRLLYV